MNKFIRKNKQTNAAFSTVELLFAVFMFAVAATALMLSLSFAIKLASKNTSSTIASNIIDNWTEKIKAMEYTSIGVSGENPTGLLQSNYTEKVGSREYFVSIKVFWVDDPKDGTGTSDLDSNPNDYKAVKITVSWNSLGAAKELSRYFYVFSK